MAAEPPGLAQPANPTATDTTASPTPEQRPCPMLAGSTVVVAGVGEGLGRQVGRVARREGADVVLGARTAPVVEKVAAELDPSGRHVAACGFDVTDPEQCARLVQTAVDRFGRLDALVVSAAVDKLFGGIDGADWGRWHRAMEVNLFGALYLVEAALPHFGSRGGSVVLVGTQSVYLPPPQLLQAGYAASKAAVLGAMRHLAVELGPRKVRLNSVAPGWMWGPAVATYVGMQSEATGQPADEVRAGLSQQLPLRQMATDADVAEAVCFFASDRSRAITGQSLLVNAGEYLH